MEDYSVGLIGGADGPTAIFVSTAPLLPKLLGALALAAVAAVIGVIIWRSRK